ncbi:MAG: ComF family protein [Phascolarctobacterium sp.]|nr:ComF family protein [Phascolarctobacterium sp.]
MCKNEIDTGYFCESCRKSFALGKELTNVEALDKVILLCKYQQQLQLAIHGVKFEGKSNLLPFLKEEAQLALKKSPHLQELLVSTDLITCVPTSPKRKQERGFEVPQELFAFLDNGKLQPNLLKRVRNTMPLFDLEPSLRRQEVAGCFEVQCSVAGKSVLICDDIYTTGSTMNEAARALKKAGATSVIALAFTASKDNW